MTKYILFPNDKPLKELMGGKAASLCSLGEKFPIPSWFVVTPEAAHQSLSDIQKEITNALKKLGDGPFAVRSSSIEEDTLSSSFAGQFKTFLNVPIDQVLESIKLIWESGSEQSVQAYRQAMGLDQSSIIPAVLVQKMVRADVAGVAFSIDPVSQNCITIVATQGLADKLVSGEVNGDTYRLSLQHELIAQHLVNESPLLSISQLSQIANVALDSEKFFGCPQDIEWAIEDGNFYLLQSRPITTFKNQEDLLIWDNSNIVESYSGIVSPLTFSFALRAYEGVYTSFCQLICVPSKRIEEKKSVFMNMLGYVNGRIYYNLINWYELISLMPGFQFNRRFMEQMMGVSESLPNHIAVKIITKNSQDKMRSFMGIWNTFWGMTWNFIILPRKINKFYRRLNAVLGDAPVPLKDMNLNQLSRYYYTLESNLLPRWDAPIVNDFLCMIFFGLSRKVLEKWAGKEGLLLHNDFMIGQGDIISAEPVQKIKSMAKIALQNPILIDLLAKENYETLKQDKDMGPLLNDYLKKFGDRCFQELKLESQTLHDNPAVLLKAISTMAASYQNKGHFVSQNVNPDEKLHSLIKNPFKRGFIKLLIKIAKASVRNRENLRFERTRVFGTTRRIFNEIGTKMHMKNVLNDPRDIFFLRLEEILGTIEGTSTTINLKQLVDLRKNEQEIYKKIKDVPNRLEARGEIYPLVSLPEQENKSEKNQNKKQGLGCCAGIVTAKVRVVTDPNQEKIEVGEILVAQHTDPGWITLFVNASGILVERGSLLSHSAIVARELGIPAVVSIPGLTKWLKTGDIVEMDGTSGIVRKMLPLQSERNPQK